MTMGVSLISATPAYELRHYRLSANLISRTASDDARRSVAWDRPTPPQSKPPDRSWCADAVIDKDRLAVQIGAAVKAVVLTSVPGIGQVLLEYGTSQELPSSREATLEAARLVKPALS